MQTPTFLQKTRVNWRSWHKILSALLLVVGLGASQTALAQASFIEPNTVSFASAPTGGTPTTTTYTNRGTATPTFPAYQDSDLGKGASFDQVTGSLSLTALRVPIDYNNTGSPGVPPDPNDPTDPGIPATPATVINSVMLKYRIYPVGTTSSNLATIGYTSVALTLSSTSGRTAVYRYSGTPIDILNQQNVLGGGTYNVQLLIIANYTSGNSTQDVSDPGTSNGRTATFKVIAPPITPNGGITIWTSQSSTDWRLASNWSNGVPSRNSDAIIPEKTAVGTTVTPVLVDATIPYEVRTITLNGTTNSTRALLRIGQSVNGTAPAIGGTLRVYGDLNTYSGGILASVSGTNGVANSETNSTIVLAGDNGGVQVVRGLLEIVDFRVEGNGVKAVVNSIAASNTFTFDSNTTAIVQTSNDDGAKDPSTGLSTTIPSLNTTKTATVNLKDSGYLFGEKPTSYIRGITIADRSLLANVKQTFGNIGIDITPNRNVPSPNVNITRTVGDPLFGPLGNTTTAPVGAPQPVKRQYGISGDVNNNTTSTITFHYLNSTDELNGNPEANLTIFKTTNNAPPYSLVGRTGTVVLGTPAGDGTVTRENYSGSLNTITLGDQDNPLPIQLSAFNAVRNGSNVLLTWATATESNNKGFNVQVSADGAIYHTLSFVASQSTNSSLPLSYKYTDMEPGKTGTRYYRLQQVDIDGKSSYSPVRAISFNGSTATDVALVAYPNPMNSNDNLGLQLQGGSIVNGLAYVKLVDMAGRTVSDQQLQIIDSSLSLGNLGALTSGLYMAKVTLPDGSTKTVRIQRQ
jgi:hypothetical protein